MPENLDKHKESLTKIEFSDDTVAFQNFKEGNEAKQRL